MQIIQQIPLSPWMEALGWTVLHSLWQGALVATLIALAFILVPKAYAHFRYGLGIAGLCAMLFWSGATFHGYMQEGPLLTSFSTQSSYQIHDHPNGITFIYEQHAGDQSWMQNTLNEFGSHIGWIAWLWMLGAIGFSMRWTGSLLYLRNLKQHAKNHYPEWQDRLDQLAQKLGINAAIPLLVSSQAKSPMVVGYLKPAIMVPVSMLSGLSSQQIEAILIHELAHIRRLDHLFNLMQSIAEVLFFYHPAFWWINARIHDEREHCCDDLAVTLTGDALSYARALTELAALRYEGNPLAVALGGRRNHLLGRIHRLLAPSKKPNFVTARMLSSFLVALTLWGLTWISPKQAMAESNPYAFPGISQLEVEPVAPRLFSNTYELPNHLAPLTETNPLALQSYAEWQLAEADSPPPLPPVPPQLQGLEDLPELPDFPDMPDLPEGSNSQGVPDFLNPDEVEYFSGDEMKAFEESMKDFNVIMQDFQGQYMEDLQKFHEQQDGQLQAWQAEMEKYQMLIEEQVNSPEMLELTEKARLMAEELSRNAHNQELSAEEIQRMEERIAREMEIAERSREENMKDAKLQMENMESEMQRMQELRARQAELMEREAELMQREQEEMMRLQESQIREQGAEMHRQEAEMRKQEVEMREQEAKMHEMEKELLQEEKRLKELQYKVKNELIRDGLIDSSDEKARLEFTDTYMKVNGKKVDQETFEKYNRMLNRETHPGSKTTIKF